MVFDWTTPPPTPYWLTAFSPEQIVGQPIQKLPVKVPSGQLWGRTPWSQQQGLESYIEYAAGTPGVIASYQDLIDRMYMMRIRNAPTRAARWAIPRQWG